MQLGIDEEELKDNWACGRYVGVYETAKAEGQAAYIQGLVEVIKQIRGSDNES